MAVAGQQHDAARGVRFSDAYAAAPVWTPSRTSIMSGHSPARNGITYWTLEKDRDTSAKHPRLRNPEWRVTGLDDGNKVLFGDLRTTNDHVADHTVCMPAILLGQCQGFTRSQTHCPSK